MAEQSLLLAKGAAILTLSCQNDNKIKYFNYLYLYEAELFQ